MREVYQVVNLGQVQESSPQPPLNESVELDREFAEVVLDAVAFLDSASEERPEIRTEACWRGVMVEQRVELNVVAGKLQGFLASTTETLVIPPEEYEVVSAVLDCVDKIADEEKEETELRIGRIATFVGIAGGVVALLALY